MPATGDRVPCVYVEDHRVVGLDPTDPIEVSYGTPIPATSRPAARPSRAAQDAAQPRPRHDHRQRHQPHRLHDAAASRRRWMDEDMADTLTGKAVAFIERNKAQPVLPLLRHARHPRAARAAPALRRQDRHGAARRRHRASSTGASARCSRRSDRLKLDDEYARHLHQRQRPRGRRRLPGRGRGEAGRPQAAGPLRGGKYSTFEGGTRVPFIVRWPGEVKPGVQQRRWSARSTCWPRWPPSPARSCPPTLPR